MVNTIIQDLLKAGLSQTDIAKEVSYPQSRISDIVNGKQITVNYEVGKRLEALRDKLVNQ